MRSFNHPVRPQQQFVAHFDSERIGGLAVENQRIAGRLLERQIAGPGALENLVDKNRGAAEVVAKISAIGGDVPIIVERGRMTAPIW